MDLVNGMKIAAYVGFLGMMYSRTDSEHVNNQNEKSKNIVRSQLAQSSRFGIPFTIHLLLSTRNLTPELR